MGWTCGIGGLCAFLCTTTAIALRHLTWKGPTGSMFFFSPLAYVVELFVVAICVVAGLVTGFFIAPLSIWIAHSKPLRKVGRRVLVFQSVAAIAIGTLMFYLQRPGGLLFASAGVGALQVLTWWAFSRREFDVNQTRFCTRCSYDLTGNISGVCPECGTAV